MKYKNIFITLAFSLIFIVSSSAACAIEYGMLGGKPANPDPAIENSGSWFIYNLNSGESREDALEVMNLFDQELDVVIYAADTIKSSSGGFALRQFGETNDKVGTWVKFYPKDVPDSLGKVFEDKDKKIVEFCKTSKEELEDEIGKKNFKEEMYAEFQKWCEGETSVERKFASKEKVIIPFVFSVPDSAEVGEHTGGILIQKKAAENVDGGQGSAVKLTTRVGVRIYQTVPGEIVRKLSISDFRIVKNFKEFSFSDWFGEKKPKEYLIETDIKNEGNVSVEHQNNLIIKNIFSGRTETIERKFQALKGDKFIANYSWRKPILGYYSFQGEIKYGDSSLTSEELKLIVIPWRELSLAGLSLVVLAGAYLLWRRYQKKKYGGIGWVEYKIGKADTVAKLSEKYRIDWKVLVKTNKIKAPYLLEAGSVVLVPPADKKKGRGEEIKLKAVEKFPEQKVSEKKKETKPEKAIRKTTDIKEIYRASKLAKSSRKSEIKIKPVFSNKLIVAVSIIFLVAVSALIFWMMKSQEKEEVVVAPKISLSSVADTNAMPEKEAVKEEKNLASEPLKKDKMNILVLNEGSPAGLAGKVKDLLARNGYSKARAGNGSADVKGNFVIVNDEKLKAESEKIISVLEGGRIMTQARGAQSAEEKSAGIVVILGE